MENLEILDLNSAAAASSIGSHDEWERKVCDNPTNAGAGHVIDGKYTLMQMLTCGASGEVWMADAGSGSNPVAVKIMFVKGRGVQGARAREVSELLRRSKTKSRGSRYVTWAFGSGLHLDHECLFFNLHGMDFRKLFNLPHTFPFPTFQIRAILWQICMGVAFLHRLDIVHTDIKPENIVLLDDALVTVCDINSEGKCYEKSILKNIEIRIIDLEDSVSRPRSLHYIPGTAGYRAPEIYGKNGWSFPVDVFAIGCIAHELFAGIPLIPWTENVREYLFCVERIVGRFGALQAQDICDVYPDMFRTTTRVPRVKVLGINPKSKSRLNRYISDTKWQRRCITEPDIKDFVAMSTRVDPHQRLSTESMIRHKIFNNYSKVHRL